VERSRHTILRLLAVTLLTSQVAGIAQEIGSPAGIKSEQSLPSRYDYVVQDLLRFCEPQKGFWIDLGAGKGQVAIPLIEKTGSPVTMLDPNQAAMLEGLDLARKKGLEDKLFAVVGVAEDMPFPDNSVDLVASRGSIFFWTDPVKGLQEVYRVLRPGGKAYIGGGAGSGYPQESVTKLIDDRKRKMEGSGSEKWKKFVRLRRPQQMLEWAEGAGLPEFQVMGKGAISAEDERVGQGVWLLFEKKPQITTRKEEDKVTAQLKGDTVTYTITSPSGIGRATIAPWKGWPNRIVFRLTLRGLESLSVSNGQVALRASVLSHSGNARLLSVKKGDAVEKVEQGSPYWTEISVFGADGEPVQGLPGKGGYFEMALPKSLFEAKPKSLIIAWIDFYRN
jgi:SAM-dependent methyltransferase